MRPIDRLLPLLLTVVVAGCDDGGATASGSNDAKGSNVDGTSGVASHDSDGSVQTGSVGHGSSPGAEPQGPPPPPPPPVPDELSALDTTPDPSCAATWLAGVYGKVVDDAGAGLGGAKVQLCLRLSPDDRLVCLSPADSNEAGSFAREIPASSRCVERVAIRLLVPRAMQPTTYCTQPLSGVSDGLLGLGEPLVIYSAAAPIDLPEEGDLTAARDVTFEGGLTMTVTPQNLEPPAEYVELRARALTSAMPCFAREVGVTRVFGFYPEAGVTGEFPLTITNDDALAPGTVVDMFVLGGLDATLPNGEPIEEAEFVAYGTATVTDDGSAIKTDPGSGAPYLSWIGYRARR